jgi:hypothetical protein
MLAGAWKVPSPLPGSTLTLLLSSLTVTTSGLPSALKSPTARERGLAPAAEF